MSSSLLPPKVCRSMVHCSVCSGDGVITCACIQGICKSGTQISPYSLREWPRGYSPTLAASSCRKFGLAQRWGYASPLILGKVIVNNDPLTGRYDTQTQDKHASLIKRQILDVDSRNADRPKPHDHHPFRYVNMDRDNLINAPRSTPVRSIQRVKHPSTSSKL